MTKQIKLKIDGMHCASCEVLIEQAWKVIPGVKSVDVNNTKGSAVLEVNNAPSLEALNNAIKEHGYTARFDHSKNKTSQNQTAVENIDPKDKHRILGIILIILAVLWIARRNGLVPDVGLSETMSFGFIFIIGLVASVSSCIATTGGLLVAVATKYTEAHPELSGYKRFRPHIYFNLGRILSYAILGGVIGAIGSTLTLSPTVNGILTIVASLVMALLGFQMLKIFPSLQRFQPKMPKKWAHKIHDLSSSDKKSTPFILGALTFFLPCGFTQALQVYALSSGNAIVGAVTMFIFALGTLPALLSLGALTSLSNKKFHLYFTQIAGALVLIIGLMSIRNGLALIDFGPVTNSTNTITTQSTLAPTNKQGVQQIAMKINGYDYEPYKFTVKKGVPVEWTIDASVAGGCMRAGIVAPGLGIQERLNSGKTIVRFTPYSAGKFKFSCPMGMGTFGAHISVVE